MLKYNSFASITIDTIVTCTMKSSTKNLLRIFWRKETIIVSFFLQVTRYNGLLPTCWWHYTLQYTDVELLHAMNTRLIFQDPFLTAALYKSYRWLLRKQNQRKKIRYSHSLSLTLDLNTQVLSKQRLNWKYYYYDKKPDEK